MTSKELNAISKWLDSHYKKVIDSMNKSEPTSIPDAYECGYYAGATNALCMAGFKIDRVCTLNHKVYAQSKSVRDRVIKYQMGVSVMS